MALVRRLTEVLQISPNSPPRRAFTAGARLRNGGEERGKERAGMAQTVEEDRVGSLFRISEPRTIPDAPDAPQYPQNDTPTRII